MNIGHKDHHLDTKYKPMVSDTNEVEAVLVISRDVTEHRMIEDQLFHTEKLASLGALSAGVAHEINNPLAVIMGFTEMLLQKAPPESKDHQILSTIYRQGDNCQKIVENLLTFARISKKTKTDTDVVADLDRVIDVVKNTLLTKKIELRTEFEEDLPRVRGDGRQLEQVFLNIINNAMAAMDDGGVLTIRAVRGRRRVRIEFSDTGRGIPVGNMGRIFEPFFTTKKVGEGTGLGLSVSYGIVKKFGGDIRVESRTAASGRPPGTTFKVILPIAEGDRTGLQVS